MANESRRVNKDGGIVITTGSRVPDKLFDVSGVIVTPGNIPDQMLVFEILVAWAESRGWQFIGTLGEVDEDGQYIGG